MHDSSGQPACGHVLICQLKIWPSLHSTSESRLLLQVQKPFSLMQRLVFQPAEPNLSCLEAGWLLLWLAYRLSSTSIQMLPALTTGADTLLQRDVLNHANVNDLQGAARRLVGPLGAVPDPASRCEHRRAALWPDPACPCQPWWRRTCTLHIPVSSPP